MKTILFLVVVLSGHAALAQDGGALAFCHGDLSQDRQPNFSADGGLNPQAVVVTGDTPPRLRLNTNLNALNPERIILPAQQNLTAMIVNDSAGNGAAHVLGWFYYDDLVTRGYVDVRDAADPNDDELLDTNRNDIPDFHEDLFNLAPPTGPEARPLIGLARRCIPRTFVVVGNDGGSHTLTEPELAVQGCGSSSTFSKTAGPRRFQTMAGYPSPVPSGLPVVGTTSASSAATDYSDLGLHAHFPNLLEPAHALNNNKGIGHLALLTTNDDSYSCPSAAYPACLLPASDKSGGGSQPNGLPDYKASAYDSLGLLKPGRSAAEAINESDRKVPLGLIDANREIVFFFVAYVKQVYGPATDSCFRLNKAGTQCNLWFHSDINVFFSKTALNMDLHQVASNPIVTTKNLGTSWLNASSYSRLNTPAYGNVVLPSVNRDVPAYGRRAAHTIVGAPPSDPTKWILGWEDQTAGGDRTYSDIVILINKQNNGGVQSGVVSGDLSPSIAVDFTINSVTFQPTDDAFYEAKPGACAVAGTDAPSITYFVALDCKTCTSGCSSGTPTFTPNPNPTWVEVPLAASAAGAVRNQSVTIDDFLDRGFTGSQLCWRAELDSPREGCEPTIHDVFVSYKAKKAGNYARSTVVPIANAIVYGTYELPGRDWYDVALSPRLPSTRLYDAKKDLSDRGHFWFTSLYDPATPNTTTRTLQWEGGAVVSAAIAGLSDPVADRTLYSMKANGEREDVKNLQNDMLPDVFCAHEASPGNYLYDLDRNGTCSPGQEKRTLVEYLYGWENEAAGLKRAWSMGGVNLSTPAVVGPPGLPPWFYKVSVPDQLAYKTNFLGAAGISTRATVSYVGTNQGYLHAFETGAFRGGDDACTAPIEQRGFFSRPGSCASARNYGTGTERWAYLPRAMITRYVGNYLRWGSKALPASIPAADRPPVPAKFDGSPAIADVDLGVGAYDPKKSNLSIQAKWTVVKNKADEGGKTVLVSGAGSGQPVFLAIDITDPSDANYPLPMWEFSPLTHLFSLGGTYPASQTVTKLFSASAVKADVLGTRFSPALGKLEFGPASATSRKWSAVFVSDYRPTAGTNPTVYVMDMKTGRPIQVDHSNATGGLAGVVTLGDATEKNIGVAGEPAIVDLNDDGIVDLVYVALTNGNVYRVNLDDVDPVRGLGKVISSCKVANTRAALTADGVANPSWQGVFSNLAVKVVSGRVRFYYGTANDPDVETEPADLASPSPSYYVLGWEDGTPLGACGATRLFTRDLGPGQAVWGGVVLSKNAVTTATAVGTGVDLCALDDNTSGKIFSYDLDTGVPLPGNGTDLGGHVVTPPVAYDEHLFILTADAKLKAKGSPTWNNKLSAATPGRSGVIIWDVDRNGRVK